MFRREIQEQTVTRKVILSHCYLFLLIILWILYPYLFSLIVSFTLRVSTFVYFISTGKLVIDFMKMIAVRDFFINSIYMIFDIIPLIHTNFYHCQKCRKVFPADKMQDEFSSCRQDAGRPFCPAGRILQDEIFDALPCVLQNRTTK